MKSVLQPAWRRWGAWSVYSTEGIINAFRYLTWKQRQRQLKMPVWQDWLEVIVSVVFAVLLINQYLVQLFVIPSGSMKPSLQVQDRVMVNKLAYGLELYPYGAKHFYTRPIQRGAVIPFVSPEYQRRSTFFTIMQRMVYLLSLSTVDLEIKAFEKNPLPPKHLASQPMFLAQGTAKSYNYRNFGFQPPLLVKRVIAVGGDHVRFVGGDLEIRLAGSKHFTSEAVIKEQLGLNYQVQRLLNRYNKAGVLGNGIRYEQRMRLSYLANPHDPDMRSRFFSERLGDAIPQGYFEPFGDNRDDSHDGRWFGLLSRNDLQGAVSYIIYPLSRLRSLSVRKEF